MAASANSSIVATMNSDDTMKIWANSGDSHLVEPDDLFTTSLPKDLAERMPRSEKDADGTHETLYVDGQVIRRRMPRAADLRDENNQSVSERAPGANDMKLRLVDLERFAGSPAQYGLRVMKSF